MLRLGRTCRGVLSGDSWDVDVVGFRYAAFMILLIMIRSLRQFFLSFDSCFPGI